MLKIKRRMMFEFCSRLSPSLEDQLVSQLFQDWPIITSQVGEGDVRQFVNARVKLALSLGLASPKEVVLYVNYEWISIHMLRKNVTSPNFDTISPEGRHKHLVDRYEQILNTYRQIENKRDKGVI